MCEFAVLIHAEQPRWPDPQCLGTPVCEVGRDVDVEAQYCIWAVAMVLGVVLSVLIGWLYYLVVERPALRHFQNFFKARRYGHV